MDGTHSSPTGENASLRAKLALENGAVFTGTSFGFAGETSGEVVFNTSLAGYQEILTDPSYCGQIVTMTYPLIGNTGVNPDDVESSKPQVAGFIVKEYIDAYSNFRATESLDSYLKRNRIVAIQGIDTRMLTKMIRTVGPSVGAGQKRKRGFVRCVPVVGRSACDGFCKVLAGHRG